MKWVKKFDVIFLWLFSLKGLIFSLVIGVLFYVTVFEIIRYKTISKFNNNYDLCIDMKKSHCVFCQEHTLNDYGNHYIVRKKNKIILKFRTCTDEGFSHPIIDYYKNDTLVIWDRKFCHIVLLKVPTNKNRVFLKDIKYEFIDKSGFPRDSAVTNESLHLIKTCYKDY